MPNLLTTVINYGFETNADYLKRFFQRLGPILLIDSSSPRSPKTTDITIPNAYYPGLWNEAVHHAVASNYEWLFVIASDVKLLRITDFKAIVNQVCATPEIGVWTPSLHKSSRCASKLSFNRGTGGLRTCSYVEGFCFLVRTDIIKQQHPIPAWNKSGWGVDVVTSWLATQQGYQAKVDDRLLIHHPRARKEHSIERDPAYADLTRYRESFGISKEMLDDFFFSDYAQLKEEGLVE